MATFMADLRLMQIQEICMKHTNSNNKFYHKGKQFLISHQQDEGIHKLTISNSKAICNHATILDDGKTQNLHEALKQPLYLVEDNYTVLGKLNPKNLNQPHTNDIIDWAITYFKNTNKLPEKVQIFSVEKEQIIINYEIPAFFVEVCAL